MVRVELTDQDVREAAAVDETLFERMEALLEALLDSSTADLELDADTLYIAETLLRDIQGRD